MTTDVDIMQRLTEIFRRVFDNPGLALTTRKGPRDIMGWDSARMVMLVLEIEQVFSIEFASRDVDRVRSIADFVTVIKAKSPA